MPYVNIRLIEGATREEKEKIIAGVTQLLKDVLNKNPERTFVTIDDVSPENWGVGGESILTRNERKASRP